MILISPKEQFQETYLSYISEFKANDEPLIPFPLSYSFKGFTTLITRLDSDSRGIDISDGFVPSSSFWMIDSEGRILGLSNLRHSLTKNLKREGGHIGYSIRPSFRGNGIGKLLLQETLIKAKEQGLMKVLITCDKDNKRSAKVIQANGGRLDSEEFIAERNEIIQRYWITME